MKPVTKTITAVKKHLGPIVFPIIYTLILLLIALLIYFYANGYRIDIFKREITQTGVASIESDPISAEIYENNQLIGKTPKSFSLLIGDFNFTVKKDGYYDWSKNASIVEGKSTLLTPWLVKKDPASNVLWTSSGDIEKTWVNNDKTHVLLLINNTTNYSLWEYTLNPALWDFSSNPSLIMDLDNSDFDLKLSPNGELALLTTTTDSTSQYYVINTQNYQKLSSIEPLKIDPSKGYTFTWSNNNKYLIEESKKEINSYNIQTKVTTNILSKATGQEYIWTTDTQNYLYIAEAVESTQTDVYNYRLKQIALDNSSTQYIIDNFYFQKTEEYINEYREDGFIYTEFSSAPESTYTAGKLTSLIVNQEGKGVFFTTTLASYWFNMDTQKFIMASPYPASLISFSEDEEKLIYQDQTGYNVFTFDKAEGDHTTSIGSKAIQNIEDATKLSDMLWISNSEYIAYAENNAIYIADKDGENKDYITESTKLLTFLVTYSRTSLVTFSQNSENKLEITNYTIH